MNFNNHESRRNQCRVLFFNPNGTRCSIANNGSGLVINCSSNFGVYDGLFQVPNRELNCTLIFFYNILWRVYNCCICNAKRCRRSTCSSPETAVWGSVYIFCLDPIHRDVLYRPTCLDAGGGGLGGIAPRSILRPCHGRSHHPACDPFPQDSHTFSCRIYHSCRHLPYCQHGNGRCAQYLY